MCATRSSASSSSSSIELLCGEAVCGISFYSGRDHRLLPHSASAPSSPPSLPPIKPRCNNNLCAKREAKAQRPPPRPPQRQNRAAWWWSSRRLWLGGLAARIFCAAITQQTPEQCIVPAGRGTIETRFARHLTANKRMLTSCVVCRRELRIFMLEYYYYICFGVKEIHIAIYLMLEHIYFVVIEGARFIWMAMFLTTTKSFTKESVRMFRLCFPKLGFSLEVGVDWKVI